MLIINYNTYYLLSCDIFDVAIRWFAYFANNYNPGCCRLHLSALFILAKQPIIVWGNWSRRRLIITQLNIKLVEATVIRRRVNKSEVRLTRTDTENWVKCICASWYGCVYQYCMLANTIFLAGFLQFLFYKYVIKIHYSSSFAPCWNSHTFHHLLLEVGVCLLSCLSQLFKYYAITDEWSYNV